MDSFMKNLDTLFNKAENFISTKTIVGDPINIGDITLIPMMDLNIAVGSSSKGEKPSKEKDSGGLAANLSATAVLVIKDGTVQFINIKNQDSLNKIIDMTPQVLNNITSFFQSKTKEGKKEKNYVDGANINEGDFS